MSEIENKKCQVVYGSRVLRNPENIKSQNFSHNIRILGNIFLTKLSNFLNNQNLTDAHTCYKLFNSDLFKSITKLVGLWTYINFPNIYKLYFTYKLFSDINKNNSTIRVFNKNSEDKRELPNGKTLYRIGITRESDQWCEFNQIKDNCINNKLSEVITVANEPIDGMEILNPKVNFENTVNELQLIFKTLFQSVIPNSKISHEPRIPTIFKDLLKS